MLVEESHQIQPTDQVVNLMDELPKKNMYQDS